MNIIDLLRDEILTLYPRKLTPEPANETYTLHCSKVFSEALKKSFLSVGFIMEAGIPVEATITKYMLPHLGTINVITDMEQGYKIEKE